MFTVFQKTKSDFKAILEICLLQKKHVFHKNCDRATDYIDAKVGLYSQNENVCSGNPPHFQTENNNTQTLNAMSS